MDSCTSQRQHNQAHFQSIQQHRTAATLLAIPTCQTFLVASTQDSQHLLHLLANINIQKRSTSPKLRILKLLLVTYRSIFRQAITATRLRKSHRFRSMSGGENHHRGCLISLRYKIRPFGRGSRARFNLKALETRRPTMKGSHPCGPDSPKRLHHLCRRPYQLKCKVWA